MKKAEFLDLLRKYDREGPLQDWDHAEVYRLAEEAMKDVPALVRALVSADMMRDALRAEILRAREILSSVDCDGETLEAQAQAAAGDLKRLKVMPRETT